MSALRARFANVWVCRWGRFLWKNSPRNSPGILSGVVGGLSVAGVHVVDRHLRLGYCLTLYLSLDKPPKINHRCLPRPGWFNVGKFDRLLELATAEGVKID